MALKTATSIDTFRVALKACLAASLALVNTPVTDGPPAPGIFDGPEWVAIMDIDFSQLARAFNVTNMPREEHYTQEILISVRRATRTDQVSPTGRAFELFRAVANAIRDNPTLSGYYSGDGQLVSVQIERGSYEPRVTPDASDRTADIRLTLAVEARI